MPDIQRIPEIDTTAAENVELVDKLVEVMIETDEVAIKECGINPSLLIEAHYQMIIYHIGHILDEPVRADIIEKITSGLTPAVAEEHAHVLKQMAHQMKTEGSA